MHKLDSVGVGGVMVGEICYLGVDQGGRRARPLQGPGRDGDASAVDAIAVGPGVIHCPLDKNIERVHRLLLGSLLPLRIVFPLKLT